jgi:hypothetical protein
VVKTLRNAKLDPALMDKLSNSHPELLNESNQK